MKGDVLVVGGAGYIGSQMVRRLVDDGYHPVMLDSLVGGRREAVGASRLVVADAGDSGALDALMQAFDFVAVMHFASFIEVGESMLAPAKYYENNVGKTVTLLDAMVRHGIERFIFSSTAAIFGEPEYVPIDEKHPRSPISEDDVTLPPIAPFATHSCAAVCASVAAAQRMSNAGQRHLSGTTYMTHAFAAYYAVGKRKRVGLKHQHPPSKFSMSLTASSHALPAPILNA